MNEQNILADIALSPPPGCDRPTHGQRGWWHTDEDGTRWCSAMQHPPLEPADYTPAHWITIETLRYYAYYCGKPSLRAGELARALGYGHDVARLRCELTPLVGRVLACHDHRYSLLDGAPEWHGRTTTVSPPIAEPGGAA